MVQAVDRSLQVLEVLSSAPEGLALSDIAVAVALPPPTARRLLLSLLSHDYVLQDEYSRRYRLGPAFSRLAGEVSGGPPGWARLQSADTSLTDVPRGLEGVVVAETAIGSVEGLKGYYHYRGYSAVELAQECTLEEVWYLLVEGSLPGEADAREFRERVQLLRVLPERLEAMLPDIVDVQRASGPLDALRTAVSIFGAGQGFRSCIEVDQVELQHQALHLTAVVPTLAAALFRLSKNKKPVPPDPGLSHAENFLYMLNGEHPAPEHARALEQYMISTIEHGFNPASFAARVVTSTGADLAAAVVAAVSAFSGTHYAAVVGRALDTLDAIGTSDNADSWIRGAITHGERIMGFGHRLYKAEDPRALLLKKIADDLGGPLVEFADSVAETAERVMREMKPGITLKSNGDYYSAIVMTLCGVPREMFTSTFASARVIGWCAHILEQAADNRIIRPSSRYIGPPPLRPVPRRAYRESTG